MHVQSPTPRLEDLLAMALAKGLTLQDLTRPGLPQGSRGLAQPPLLKNGGSTDGPRLLTQPTGVGPNKVVVPLSQEARPGAAAGAQVSPDEYFRVIAGLPGSLVDDFVRNVSKLGVKIAELRNGGTTQTGKGVKAIGGEAGPELEMNTLPRYGHGGDTDPELQGMEEGTDQDWDAMDEDERRRLLQLLQHADLPMEEEAPPSQDSEPAVPEGDPFTPTGTDPNGNPMLPARRVEAPIPAEAQDPYTPSGTDPTGNPTLPARRVEGTPPQTPVGADPQTMARNGMPDLAAETPAETPVDGAPAPGPSSTAVRPGDKPGDFITVNGVKIPLLVARGILADIDAGMTPARTEEEARLKGIQEGTITPQRQNLQNLARLPLPEPGKTGQGAGGTIRWTVNEDGSWTWERKAVSLAEADQHKTYGYNSRGEPDSSEPGWVRGGTVKDLDEVRQMNALLVGGSNPSLEANPAFNQQRGEVTNEKGQLDTQGLRREMELDPNLLNSVRAEVGYFDSPAGLTQRTREAADADPKVKRQLASDLITSGDLPAPTPEQLTEESKPVSVRSFMENRNGEQWTFQKGVSYEPVTEGQLYPAVITVPDGRQYYTEDGQSATLLPADGALPQATAGAPATPDGETGAAAPGQARGQLVINEGDPLPDRLQDGDRYVRSDGTVFHWWGGEWVEDTATGTYNNPSAPSSASQARSQAARSVTTGAARASQGVRRVFGQ